MLLRALSPTQFDEQEMYGLTQGVNAFETFQRAYAYEIHSLKSNS